MSFSPCGCSVSSLLIHICSVACMCPGSVAVIGIMYGRKLPKCWSKCLYSSLLGCMFCRRICSGGVSFFALVCL